MTRQTGTYKGAGCSILVRQSKERHTHTHTHTHTHRHKHTNARTHTHTHTDARPRHAPQPAPRHAARPHARTLTHSLTHTHTRTDGHTQAHTHRHIHTHTRHTEGATGTVEWGPHTRAWSRNRATMQLPQCISRRPSTNNKVCAARHPSVTAGAGHCHAVWEDRSPPTPACCLHRAIRGASANHQTVRHSVGTSC